MKMKKCLLLLKVGGMRYFGRSNFIANSLPCECVRSPTSSLLKWKTSRWRPWAMSRLVKATARCRRSALMATEQKIKASRQNAKRSTGPRTTRGRAHASRNALRHGLAVSIANNPIHTRKCSIFWENEAKFSSDSNPP
jgi:hypothetical protein